MHFVVFSGIRKGPESTLQHVFQVVDIGDGGREPAP